jgi:hypothetical protein
MYSPQQSEKQLTPEALVEYQTLNGAPLENARALRDFVFSRMPIGSSITTPYWFAPDTTFSMPMWKLLIPVVNRPPLTRSIDFDIKLYDGSNLLELKNQNLLHTFQYFFSYQLHPRYTGGQVYAPEVAYINLTRALQIADWILLNGERFKICDHGLSLINENSVLDLLDTITKQPSSESIYNYPGRLRAWIEARISEVSNQDVSRALEEDKSVGDTVDVIRELGLTTDQIVRARVLFKRTGLYTNVLGERVLRAAPIIAEIYGGTFNGRGIKPKHFTELDIGETRYNAEFDPVEVRGADNKAASYRTLSSYIQTFRKIGLINEVVTGIDDSMLQGITKDRVIAGKDYGESGRYRTAPIEVVLQGIRCSIEFSLENADWIIQDIYRVIEAKFLAHEDPRADFQNLAAKSFTETALSKGVRSWAISKSDSQYHEKVRANTGLVHLYQVLVGSVQMVVGAVMARRRDEIAHLDSETCLEPATNPSLPENLSTRYYLVFEGQKTGAMGHREMLRRPIPRIAASFIWKLQVLNTRLQRLGCIKSPGRLFKSLSKVNASVTEGSRNSHYNCMNAACDYFQLPTINDNGVEKRYYIRQHQLRRFFAIAFFWGTDDPDFQTLSWMIGHTDAKLFYHYVTELVTGRILKEAKANRIQSSLTTGKQDIIGLDQLVDELRKQYNVKRIHVKTYSEVFRSMEPMHRGELIHTSPDFNEYIKSYSCEGQIMEYLEKGKITLEPDFFESQDAVGQTVFRFNLVLKVKDL